MSCNTVKHNYSINRVCSRSGGSFYTALMVAVGRHSGGEGPAVKEPRPHAAVMKWPHPSCRHPGKERAYLAAEPMTDGSRRQLFSPKGAETPDAETCSLNGGCLQHESGEWTDSRRRWCHRKKGLICIGLIWSAHWGCPGLLQILVFFSLYSPEYAHKIWLRWMPQYSSGLSLIFSGRWCLNLFGEKKKILKTFP